jgi:ParB family chromosome partitioning protein
MTPRSTATTPPPASTLPASPRKGGLGRGLAALIPTAPAGLGVAGTGGMADGGVAGPGAPDGSNGRPGGLTGCVAGAVYQEVPIGAIQPNSRQPRTTFDEESLHELAHSIKEFGLLQPIVVRPTAGGRYELVVGERRWRAAQQAGLQRIPAIVRSTADDAMLRDALLENIHRVQLNPLEEAAAYQQLLEDFGVTHEQLAARIGRSRPTITNTVRLLKLPLAVQRRVAAGVLSAGHARALLSLEDPRAQEELAARIVAEGLSVRATEEAVTLGGAAPQAGRTATTRPARSPMRAPGLQELAEQLSDAFDTRVKVELGRRKGRIVVEFGSIDDLERLADLLLRPGDRAPHRVLGTERC